LSHFFLLVFMANKTGGRSKHCISFY